MAARRKSPATLDDLIAAKKPAGVTVADWAEQHGIGARTLYRLRHGLHEPRLGTLGLLAKALGVDVATVRAAVEASRGG